MLYVSLGVPVDRHVLGDKTYTGTFQKYNFKLGYGFISADGDLPKKVYSLSQSFFASIFQKLRACAGPFGLNARVWCRQRPVSDATKVCLCFWASIRAKSNLEVVLGSVASTASLRRLR